MLPNAPLAACSMLIPPSSCRALYCNLCTFQLSCTLGVLNDTFAAEKFDYQVAWSNIYCIWHFPGRCRCTYTIMTSVDLSGQRLKYCSFLRPYLHAACMPPGGEYAWTCAKPGCTIVFDLRLAEPTLDSSSEITQNLLSEYVLLTLHDTETDGEVSSDAFSAR